MDLVLVIGLAVAGALLAFTAFLIYQLVLQNGRVLVRLDALEQWSAPWDESDFGVEEYLGSLPVGVPAPAINLPDLNGAQRALSEWRGHRVLLVFFDPESIFCRQLLPYIVALASDVIPDRPVPVVVTTGDLEANRALFDGAGFEGGLLLQAGMEVATAYKVDATPMSYLVEPDGTIGSEVATGIQATLILAGDIASIADATTTSHVDPPHAAGLLTETGKGALGGLSEGSSAPVFRLPRLDGGELSLLDYRGSKVLVVFSDPHCEPCDALAPLLEHAHQTLPEVAFVMISRGDVEANQAKVAEHGLSFPVALQRHWEISREYRVLETPVAFLVDEWGAIAAEVAIGPDAIIALLAGTTSNEDTAAPNAYNGVN